jgi:hypothetical protein
MSTRLPSSAAATGELVWILSEAAYEAARGLYRRYKPVPVRQRPSVGATLRPGPATPLWNALVREVRMELRRRGDKVRLGRLLGLPRQRVHDFLVGRGRMPDAERTLLLMEWLVISRHHRGKFGNKMSPIG